MPEKDKNQKRTFNLIIFALGSIFLFLILKSEIKDTKLEKNGIIDTAIITDLRYGPKNLPYVEYEFVSNGISYFGLTHYSYENRTNFQVGKYFLVKYLPNNPTNNKLITDKDHEFCEVIYKNTRDSVP